MYELTRQKYRYPQEWETIQFKEFDKAVREYEYAKLTHYYAKLTKELDECINLEYEITDPDLREGDGE